jgi:uncharacterized membrane protein YfcA
MWSKEREAWDGPNSRTQEVEQQMDFLLVDFSVSGVTTWVLLPPVVAFIVSFFTSMGGISGAFLLLPFQISFLGYTHPSVSATNQLFNVVAIPSGVFRFCREGRMVWPLTWIVVAGTLPGVFIGAIVRIVYLPDPKHFKLFAAAVLLYVGLRMVRDLAKKPGKGKGTGERRFQQSVRDHLKEGGGQGSRGHGRMPAVKVTRFDRKRLGYVFYGEQFEISLWFVFTLSLIVGIVGGVYGIGGGAIIAPFLVTFLSLPVYTVAGAALMGTFVTSVAAVVFYQGIAPFHPELSIAPDWPLGVLFGFGGMAGMYLGARCQKYVSAGAIKWMLAAVILFTALSYIGDFLGM